MCVWFPWNSSDSMGFLRGGTKQDYGTKKGMVGPTAMLVLHMSSGTLECSGNANHTDYREPFSTHKFLVVNIPGNIGRKAPMLCDAFFVLLLLFLAFIHDTEIPQHDLNPLESLNHSLLL